MPAPHTEGWQSFLQTGHVHPMQRAMGESMASLFTRPLRLTNAKNNNPNSDQPPSETLSSMQQLSH